MELLDNVVMPYPWGSRTFLARLRGHATPSAAPEAELWMGAHPVAPSKLTRGGARSLLEAIAEGPGRELGSEVAVRFASKMPFLLKVLAAEEPLSLQAHPSEEQAREGFAREEAAGIPLDAPHRTYKDPSHKPELIVALEPLDALCGFRQPRELLELLDALACPELARHAEILRGSLDGDGLHAMFVDVLGTPVERRAALVDATRRACLANRGRFDAATRWIVRLADRYPSDTGVVCALMLAHVRLEKDQALYLPAGNLHAYLHGAGVEIMASSDNVLRGGLTSKHVDVAELTRVVRFDAPRTPVVEPRALGASEVVWDTPTAEFRLSRVEVTRERPFHARPNGPEILLCVHGAVVGAGEGVAEIACGRAAFVRGSEGPYTLTGEGTVFRATVGVDDGSLRPPTNALR